MLQNYANIEQELHDVNMDKLIEYSKTYTSSKLIAVLKLQYPCHWQLVYDQLALLAKAQRKLPTWVKHECFFTTRSLEQCSSEGLAAYKAALFNGKLMLDLSGGFGVDDFYFSKSFQEVISTDNNAQLNELVRFNQKRLGLNSVIRLDETAEHYLSSTISFFDLIYVDADRRPDSKAKIVTLEDSTPNILALLPQLQLRTNNLLLKLSPMVDLSYLLKVLPNLQRLEVVGMKNEVKEILAYVNFSQQPTSVEVKALQVDEVGQVEYSFSSSITKEAITMQAGGEQAYFYEPSVMLIKAGLSKLYAQQNGLNLVASQSHYMLGQSIVQHFFGRSFYVVSKMPFSKATVKQYLKSQSIVKANVSARNFVDSVDGLRKTFNLADGGEEYLFFSTDTERNKWMWHTRKN